jgi:hypothetical protein
MKETFSSFEALKTFLIEHPTIKITNIDAISENEIILTYTQ